MEQVKDFLFVCLAIGAPVLACLFVWWMLGRGDQNEPPTRKEGNIIIIILVFAVVAIVLARIMFGGK